MKTSINLITLVAALLWMKPVLGQSSMPPRSQVRAAAAASATPLSPWLGEHFGRRQGGLYLKVALRGFGASRQTRFLTGNVQITIENVLNRRLFVISHSPQDPEAAPRELWKLNSGKYKIKSIVMVDAAGVKRQWLAPPAGEQHMFSVKRHCLSNLGIWILEPKGLGELKLTLKSRPNSYSESGPKAESSVAAVVDGFTGLVQEAFGGRRVLRGSERNFEKQNEMRATVVSTRRIAMFYKLDLLRHNHHAPKVAEVLNVYDPNLRRCYTDRLDVNQTLRGSVKFTFILSKTTGTMARIKHTGGTARDPKLVECMYYQLAQIQFPVSENMVGELTYNYDVE